MLDAGTFLFGGVSGWSAVFWLAAGRSWLAPVICVAALGAGAVALFLATDSLIPGLSGLAAGVASHLLARALFAAPRHGLGG